jgi:simple sugar transport system permease protein
MITAVNEAVAPLRPRRMGLGRAAAQLGAHPELLPLALLIGVSLAFEVANPAFLSSVNVTGILAFMPELGLIALGMTLLLTAGQFDLSVGAVFGFVPLLVFILVNNHGVALPIAIVVGLAAGAAIGLVNGILVTKAGVSSFLVTLSTQLIVGGGALYISSGFPQPTFNDQSGFANALDGTMSIGGVTLYAGLAWFVGVAVVLWYVLTQTRVGNWITATGGNADAAQARGIRTDRVTICLFVLVAALAGFAGIISDVRVGSAYPAAGTGYELQAIAMCVVGGTSLFGGAGTIPGTVIGVLLLLVIRNGVILIGVPGLAYDMFVGAVILIAMLLQSGLRRFRMSGGRS